MEHSLAPQQRKKDVVFETVKGVALGTLTALGAVALDEVAFAALDVVSKTPFDKRNFIKVNLLIGSVSAAIGGFMGYRDAIHNNREIDRTEARTR